MCLCRVPFSCQALCKLYRLGIGTLLMDYTGAEVEPHY